MKGWGKRPGRGCGAQFNILPQVHRGKLGLTGGAVYHSAFIVFKANAWLCLMNC